MTEATNTAIKTSTLAYKPEEHELDVGGFKPEELLVGSAESVTVVLGTDVRGEQVWDSMLTRSKPKPVTYNLPQLFPRLAE